MANRSYTKELRLSISAENEGSWELQSDTQLNSLRLRVVANNINNIQIWIEDETFELNSRLLNIHYKCWQFHALS